MKRQNIKTHLSPYSIYQKRMTTINHAFASAIAPVHAYDDEKVSEALHLLEQDPQGDLTCVYCESPATTWDHLIGLVEKGNLRGYGHQIGNLVPSCRDCNSEKGSHDWEVYLRRKIADQSSFNRKRSRIAEYRDRYAVLVDLEHAAVSMPHEWERYDAIKKEISGLMKEADKIAARLRGAVIPGSS